MASIHKNHIHGIELELRFRAIPTEWVVRKDRLSEDRYLVPRVNQHIERKASPVIGPDGLLRSFLRLKITEQSALKFLQEVGVWGYVEDRALAEGMDGTLARARVPGKMKLWGAFGHRWLQGRALPILVTDLEREQRYWKDLSGNRAKLRTAFGRGPDRSDTPARKERFAFESFFLNTLPLHMEWQGARARAVVEPVSAQELFRALAWLDLLSNAESKVCQNPNCNVPYTRGGHKFCSFACGHNTRMRECRRKRFSAKPTP